MPAVKKSRPQRQSYRDPVAGDAKQTKDLFVKGAKAFPAPGGHGQQAQVSKNVARQRFYMMPFGQG